MRKLKNHPPAVELRVRQSPTHSDPIPEELVGLLTKDERFQRHFDVHPETSQGDRVYTTSKRVFVIHNKTIRDFDLKHITSTIIGSKKDWYNIVFSVLVCGFGLAGMTGIINLENTPPDSLGIVPLIPIIGGVMIYFASKKNIYYIKLNVPGLEKSPEFIGPKQETESLFKIIRESKA